MKKGFLACFLVLSAFAYCDKAPREVWLSFQANFKKPLIYGYCYGLQDAYSSVRDVAAAGTLLRADAERSMAAMRNVDAFIQHVDAICQGKFEARALPESASIHEILRFALGTFKKDF